MALDYKETVTLRTLSVDHAARIIRDRELDADALIPLAQDIFDFICKPPTLEDERTRLGL